MDRDSTVERGIEHQGHTWGLGHEISGSGAEEAGGGIRQQAEKNGACGGLMPFVNKGVWEALDREVSLVLVGNVDLLVDDRGLLYMMDQKGQVLGEYVTPAQREKIMKEKPETRFLSEDFILHGDIDIEGEPYFLINETHFDHLKDVEGIERVTGSLST